MDLSELIFQIGLLDNDSVVFVESSVSLSPETAVIIVPLEQYDQPGESPGRYREFMDVWHIKEVLAGKAALNDCSSPTRAQSVEWILEYSRKGA